MCQALRGRKSKYIDKGIRLGKGSQWESDMWKGRDFPLEWLDQIWWREEEKREKKEREENREEEKMSEKLLLLSRFAGDRTVGFRQSKRESSSTR